jgi:hypothetical protein
MPNSQSFPENNNIHNFLSTFHLKKNQKQTCCQGGASQTSMLMNCSDLHLLTHSLRSSLRLLFHVESSRQQARKNQSIWHCIFTREGLGLQFAPRIGLSSAQSPEWSLGTQHTCQGTSPGPVSVRVSLFCLLTASLFFFFYPDHSDVL